jgi:hypothetical protein
VSILRIALAAAVVASPAGLAACGDDQPGGQVREEALRDCLTEQGLTVEASDLGSSAAAGNATPDFQVRPKTGEIADILVVGSDEKAKRRAADISGAKQSLGAGQTDIVVSRNAVIIFEQTPPDAFRRQVETCLQ